MTTVDYYEALGISQTATEKQIKNAYRTLAFRYHPDRSGNDPDAVEKMKQLNEAYAVLSNIEKRRQYDSLRQRYGTDARQQFRQTFSEQDIFKDSDVWRVFEEMAKQFGIRGFEETFRPFYGPGFQQFHYQRPGFFAKGFFFIGPTGSRQGRKHRQLSGKSHRGFLRSGFRQALLSLLGSAMPGKMASESSRGADRLDTIQLTPNLSRSGGAYAYFDKPNDKKFVVKIPPGVRDGQRIRLAGLGEKGPMGAGDLYLKVRIHQSLPEKIKGLVGGIFKKS
jgi:DnaJ-class molecular chaperone